MGHRHSKAKDVQLPSLSNIPYVPLKLILQHVYNSEGSAALRCRLVSKSFNDAMLTNIRLRLYYQIQLRPDRCRLSLTTTKRPEFGRINTFPTEQLVNSSLISRIFRVKVTKDMEGDWDQQDLLRWASLLRRTVNVSLHSYGSLPLLPLVELPQMRVVTVNTRTSRNLAEPEVNLLVSLQHLCRLSTLSRSHLLQLNQRVHQWQISHLEINWDFHGVANVEFSSFISNFELLQSLQISNINLNFDRQTDSFTFRGVRLPHLIQCYIGLRCLMPTDSAADSIKRLLKSMGLAMPKLKKLSWNLLRSAQENVDSLSRLTSVFFRFCPTTVNICSHWENNRISHTRSQWKWYFRSLFTSVLESNLTQVAVYSRLEPTWHARPFQFKKCRSGVQVGRSEEITVAHWLNRLPVPAHKYQLKRSRNGQICKLDIRRTAL